jgi:ABC-type transporter MlaC component
LDSIFFGVCLRAARLTFVAVATLPLIMARLSGTLSTADPAAAFVKQNIERVLSLLNDASLSDLQRKEQLHDVMTGLLGLHQIALFALGPYAKRASQARVDQFEDAFADCSIEIYESALAPLKELTFRLSGATRYADDDVVVRGEFSTPDFSGDRRPIRIEFRVHEMAGGQHAITDMGVEDF